MEGIRYCEANNIASWAAHCRVFGAWADAHLQPPGDPIAAMRKAIEAAAATTALGVPLLRAALAQAMCRAGDVAEAARFATQALAELEATRQAVFLPSVLTIQAECLARTAEMPDAMRRFELAERHARNMGATLLEQRALERRAQLALVPETQPD
jgi:hypothetical protein